MAGWLCGWLAVLLAHWLASFVSGGWLYRWPARCGCLRNWLLIKYLGNRLFGYDCLGGWRAMGPFFFQINTKIYQEVDIKNGVVEISLGGVGGHRHI